MALQEELEKQGTWLFRYRGTLPLIILCAGTIFYLQTKLHPETSFFDGTSCRIYYEIGCLLVSLLGFVVRCYTVGHTPKNTSGRNTATQVAESLNTSGIYSMVRHPLYCGNFLMWLGPALLTENIWFIIVFALIYWIYYERIMFAEEQFLRRKFGQKYIEWAEITPAFIPKIGNYETNILKLSWKKVLKQEKNGLLALFMIFAAFDIMGKVVEKRTDYNYFIIAAVGVALINYLILKYLKKYTNVLNEEDR